MTAIVDGQRKYSVAVRRESVLLTSENGIVVLVGGSQLSTDLYSMRLGQYQRPDWSQHTSVFLYHPIR